LRLLRRRNTRRSAPPLPALPRALFSCRARARVLCVFVCACAARVCVCAHVCVCVCLCVCTERVPARL